MKLIVTGATGFVGTEVLRQALNNKAVTNIIALSRRPIQKPSSDTSKLQNVILEDWTKEYPDSVKEQLKGADACIWFVTLEPLLWCTDII
jgi:uncharacterized protein YbjT (DUF2867 family)